MTQVHIDGMASRIKTTLGIDDQLELIKDELKLYWDGCITSIYAFGDVIDITKALNIDLTTGDAMQLKKDLANWNICNGKFDKQDIKDYLTRWHQKNVLSKIVPLSTYTQVQALLIVKLKPYDNTQSARKVLYAGLFRAAMPWEGGSSVYLTAFGNLQIMDTYQCSKFQFLDNQRGTLFTGRPFHEESLFRGDYEQMRSIMKHIIDTGEYPEPKK